MASLFLKMMRGINDQRIIGFVALSIGALNMWQNPQIIYSTLPTIEFLKTSLNIDLRIYTDLMIISGVYLVLSRDTSSRWFLVSTLPLQIYIVTAILEAKSTNIIQSGFPIGDVVIAIIIYRQIIKLILLEIINGYNSIETPLANGGQENGKRDSESLTADGNSWYSSNLGLDLATVGTSDKPVDQKQDERSGTDDGESNSRGS